MVALPRLYGKGSRLYGVNAVQFKLERNEHQGGR